MEKGHPPYNQKHKNNMLEDDMDIIKKERVFYVDNLRLLMIVFVVMVHLACTYSTIGSWYYYEEKVLGDLSLIFFAFFQSFSQAYFMGLLFLLAGYFVPGAYDKKGFGRFVKDRLFRLGIPILIYMLLLHPFIIYILLGDTWSTALPPFLDYYRNYITTDFISESGPLWFAFALLIFSFIYALIRLLSKYKKRVEVRNIPSNKVVVLLMLIIAGGAFLIRIIQPIGTNVMNMQLCFFTQYVALFIVGILIYRHNWMEKASYRWGIRWLKVAIIPGPIIWLAMLILGGALTNGFEPFMGGLTWQSLVYAMWESFTSVAMSIGLITLFKEKWHHQNKITKILSDNAFGVYVFHTPIIIAITLFFKDWVILPFIKFLVMSIICLPICFVVSHLILRRIPLLKKVI